MIDGFLIPSFYIIMMRGYKSGVLYSCKDDLPLTLTKPFYVTWLSKGLSKCNKHFLCGEQVYFFL